MNPARKYSPARIANRRIEWLKPVGKDLDIVLTTRLRLARNIAGYKFPCRAGVDELEKILRLTLDAVDKSMLRVSSSFYDLRFLDETARSILVERRIISPELAELDRPGGAVVARGEESSFMINEEDHIKMYSVASGMEVDKAWNLLKKLSEKLEARLDFSYNEKLGYLTSSPTNVGSGLKISYYCHLPGLTILRRLDQVFETLLPAGVAVRGFLGEGSKSLGNIFQISNQATLGVSEKDILDRASAVIKELVKAERIARNEIYTERNLIALDFVHRSFAILKNARLMGPAEFVGFFSALRFGVDLGWVAGINRNELNRLLLNAQPGHIRVKMKGNPEQVEMDRVRALLVRNALEKAEMA